MKKRMIIKILLLIILMLVSTCSVQAYSGEIDPEGYITMPSIISVEANEGKGNIKIASSAGSNNTVYYQKVDITSSVYDQINSKAKERSNYISTENAKIGAELTEVQSLANEYSKLEKDENATQEQKDAAYKKYEDANNVYKEHVNTYKAKIKELTDEYYTLVPNYVESNWVTASGNSNDVTLDFSNCSGKIYFILWAKLVTNNGTYYDCGSYASITASTESTKISLDKTSAELKVSETLKLNATTNSSEKITWASSKENVATVDSNGNVKAIAEGTTVITATVGKISANCTINVTKASDTTTEEKNENSDFSKAKFEYDSDNFKYLKITISDYTTKKDSRYYMYISKNKNENITTKPETAMQISFNENGIGNAFYANDDASKILEYKGTNYIYIIEQDIYEKTYKTVLTAKEMPTISLPGLGLRLDLWLYNAKETQVENRIELSDNRNITYKIGKITSNDILKSFKNDSSSVAYSNLLKYAKNSEYIKTGTITTKGLEYNIVNDITLESDAYYFVYMIADNKDGKYIDVEDVAIYIDGTNKEGNKLIHFDFADIKVNEDDTTVTEKDDTIVTDKELPQTGTKITLLMIIIFTVLIATVSYVKIRKMRDIH